PGHPVFRLYAGQTPRPGRGGAPRGRSYQAGDRDQAGEVARHRRDVTAKRWEALSPAERRATAKAVAKELPTGFQFEAVRACRLGEVRQHVAFFRQGEGKFALILGGKVGVGYDCNRRWVPNPDELD